MLAVAWFMFIPKVDDDFRRDAASTAVGIWQRSLHTLFSLAEIQGRHPHCFRDTFAVELLISGVPLERISVLLGHQSVRVTEKHSEDLEFDLNLLDK